MGIFGFDKKPPIANGVLRPTEDQLYKFFSAFMAQLAAEERITLEQCFGESFGQEYDVLRLRKSLEENWPEIEVNFAKVKCKMYFDWAKASNDGLQQRLDALVRRVELTHLSKDLQSQITTMQTILKNAGMALKEQWREVDDPKRRIPGWNLKGWAKSTKLKLSDITGKLPGKAQDFNRDFDAEYKRNAMRNMKI